MTHAHFESLRHLVHSAPTLSVWTRLCQTLERFKADDRELALDYVEAHLASWPDQVRRYHCINIAQWTDAPPFWWRSVRSLSVQSRRSWRTRRRSGKVSMQTRFTPMGQEGAEALAQSPQTSCLTHLDLEDVHIKDDGVEALSRSPHLAGLMSIDLESNSLGTRGVEALANSPYMSNLRFLYLGRNYLWHDLTPLARSPYLTRVEHLNLGHTLISPRDAELLATSPTLSNVTHLYLHRTSIDMEGLEALAASPSLKRLQYLDLEGNELPPQEVQALFEASPALQGVEVDL